VKKAFLLFSVSMIGYGQIKVGPCGNAPTLASNPDTTLPPGVAAKPGKRRADSPVLPQIRYPRPPVAPSTRCWCGTVGAASLTSADSSQEVPMITGLAGNFRLDHVLIQETNRFTATVVNQLRVSVRSTTGIDLISGFNLGSEITPQNFAYVVPIPVALTGVYDLVLNFTGSAPLAIDGSPNFNSGSLSWEVCGNQVRINQ
jgi:hypothetical protein